MHLGVDYFTSKLPQRLGMYLKVAMDVCILVFSAVIVYAGIQVVPINLQQLSPALNIPMGAVYAAIPIGFLLIFIYYLSHLIDDWKSCRSL